MVNFNFVTLLAGLCASAAIQDAVKRDVSSDGCKKELPSNRSVGHEYLIPYKDDQGHDRDYLLFIPPKYSKTSPNPIIFSYHGGTKTPEEQRDLDLLETPYFNKDHIVVYLRGYEGRWEGVPNITPRNDVLYTNTVLDDLESTYCIDKSRVFMTGKSNGGGFTNFAACNNQLSTRFAAFAPVSGSYYIENVTDCNPKTVKIPCDAGRTNIPMIEFHGGIDGTIPYNGSDSRRGACLPDVFHWVTEWAVRDGLGEKPTECNITSRAQRYQWGSGDKKGLVTHVFEKDVDHSWPYTGANDDNKAHGDGPASYNASSYIMNFFSKHPLS
ncbi:Bifunctional acetylxylan esterase/xylanase XynS20E [Colletotrichum sp. SAR11_240]|nr:Bifunctional acetylxylan esterase/xylanase XynS20E [Colletotrichum sp. SAR11_240]